MKSSPSIFRTFTGGSGSASGCSGASDSASSVLTGSATGFSSSADLGGLTVVSMAASVVFW